MIRKECRASASGMTIAMLVFMNAILLKTAYIESGKYYWALLISVPLSVIAIWESIKDMRRKAQKADASRLQKSSGG